MNYEIKISPLNGMRYAIFANCGDAEQAANLFPNHPISCFDGYENAYCLDITLTNSELATVA